MKIFLDTAQFSEIQTWADSGLIDGVTTNPSLILKANKDFVTTIREICAIVSGPVSAEVPSVHENEMYEQALKLAAIAPNVCVKLPLTPPGLKVCKRLAAQNINTNVTLCFTVNQALLAAKAGATFVSPFVGRLDDIGINGIGLIQDIRQVFDTYGLTTQILAASLRHVMHIQSVALAGADVATIPPNLLQSMFAHPLTQSGLEKFVSDWQSTGQKL